MSVQELVNTCYVVACDGCGVQFPDHYLFRQSCVMRADLAVADWTRTADGDFCPACSQKNGSAT